MKKYEAPELFVDSFIPDTIIASASTKNWNPAKNQNCWGCDQSAGQTDRTGKNSCCYIPDPDYPDAYNYYCT